MPNQLSASKSLLLAARQADTDAKREGIMSAEEKKTHMSPRPTNLTPEIIAEAWSLISPAGHSVLTKSQVLDNLRIFFPHISAKEVRDLVGTGNMSVDKLTHLLLHADVPAVDPNAEAFKILDSAQTGFVDAHVLKKLLLQVHGMDQVDDADMQLIMQLCDADKDGRISLKDFATVGSWAPVKEAPTEFTRKLMLEKLKEAQGIRKIDD